MQPQYQDDDDDNIIVIQFTEQQAKQLDKDHLDNTSKFLASTAPYRLDSWYQNLKPFTFETEFFTMKAIEAYGLFLMYHGEELGPREEKGLDELRGRVGEIMEKKFGKSGCFVKLSTRSPKDYSWDFRDPQYQADAVNSLTQHLRQLNLKKSTDGLPRPLTLPELNSLYTFLMQFSRYRMRIQSPAEFIKLFTASERIVIDLENLATVRDFMFRRFKEGDYEGEDSDFIVVCLRQWEDFKWQNEFRCFYHDYLLTGVCQYEQDCVFPHWLDKEAFLKQKTTEFFDQLKPHLQQSNLSQGVIDICFSNDLQSLRMVEVNPFDENTRASLFKWKEDGNILKGKELVVRLRKEYSERLPVKMRSIMGMLEKGSAEVVQQALVRVYGDSIYFE